MNQCRIVIVALLLLLTGWCANDLISRRTAYAQKSVEYRVVYIDVGAPYERHAAIAEKTMNTHAQQGWRVVTFTRDFIVFQR
jgi:hypothetical protein